MTRSLLPETPKSSNDNNLIPLINIVFLLLIFFMVAGQFKTAQSGAVQLPSSSQSKVENSQAIKIIINQQGEIFLSQTAATSHATSAQALGEFFSQLPSAEPTQVSLYADQNLSAAQLHLALGVMANYPQLSINLHTRNGGQD
ncbi:ExbD/TolR family protein [Zhongshania sp.]|uniref:ExbD/TolR family protein n=1 Tax=Zhongshania sp. TaxID=1971902 RepID=UPI003568D7C2